ncbi:hypothetical protein [Runella sp.]|uniref:hypothetical protein n=1 Tax=Runella sp. TaxID=1960881 RepID=UPI003D1510EA
MISINTYNCFSTVRFTDTFYGFMDLLIDCHLVGNENQECDNIGPAISGEFHTRTLP